MKVYFNSVGIVTSVDTAGDNLRQGAVGVTLKSYFIGKNNANYIATLNFTRSDGSSISGLVMSLDQSNSECYNYIFADPWFFAKSGRTTLTIYLHDSAGTVLAQGQVQFDIEKTDYDGEPTISISQYNELVSVIEGKASTVETIITVKELPNINDFEIGQIIYLKNSSNNAFYEAKVQDSVPYWEEIYNFDASQYATKSEVQNLVQYLSQQISGKSTVSGVVEHNKWTKLTINGETHDLGGSGGGGEGGGTTYTAGTGIDISEDVISVDTTVMATRDYVLEEQAPISAEDYVINN